MSENLHPFTSNRKYEGPKYHISPDGLNGLDEMLSDIKDFTSQDVIGALRSFSDVTFDKKISSSTNTLEMTALYQRAIVLLDKKTDIVIDGRFGPKTHKSLKAIQKEILGFMDSDDGLPGPKTTQAIIDKLTSMSGDSHVHEGVQKFEQSTNALPGTQDINVNNIGSGFAIVKNNRSWKPENISYTGSDNTIIQYKIADTYTATTPDRRNYQLVRIETTIYQYNPVSQNWETSPVFELKEGKLKLKNASAQANEAMDIEITKKSILAMLVKQGIKGVSFEEVKKGGSIFTTDFKIGVNTFYIGIKEKSGEVYLYDKTNKEKPQMVNKDGTLAPDGKHSDVHVIDDLRKAIFVVQSDARVGGILQVVTPVQ